MKSPIWIISLLTSALLPCDMANAFPRDSEVERSAAEQSEPTGELSLHEALAAAESRNPALASYSWSTRAATARYEYSDVLPNPELSLEAENIGGSGELKNGFENTLQLSQLVELGGKRARRKDLAGREKDKTQLEFDAKRLDVLFDTTIDFIETVSEQETEKLARVGSAQARGLVEEARKRTTAGVGSPLEVKRAQILTARAEIFQSRAERRLHAAKYKLASQWGAIEPRFSVVKGDLFGSQPVPALADLLERIEQAPDRRAAEVERQVALAEEGLARAKRSSDFSVSVGWRHGESLDDQAAVAGFSVPLRIFDRGQGDSESAAAMVQKASAGTSAAELKLRAALVGLHQELLRASEEMELLRKEIVPRAEESLVLAKDGFGKGLFSQLELLEAQKTLVEVKLEQIEAAAEYHRLVAETERLLGGPL